MGDKNKTSQFRLGNNTFISYLINKQSNGVSAKVQVQKRVFNYVQRVTLMNKRIFVEER